MNPTTADAPIDATPPRPLPGLFASSWVRDGRGLKWALVLLVLSFTVFSRFGLTLGTASVNSSLIVMYGLLFVAWASGRLALATDRLLLFLVLFAVAGTTTAVNMSLGVSSDTSLTSVLLLVLVHLPLVAMLRPGPGPVLDSAWLQKVFADVALLCAVVGIVQFAAQFAIKAPWLFNPDLLIPELLRSTGGYNVVIAVESKLKSNGFFFKEPSLFSLTIAFGMLLEIAVFRRWWRLAVLAVAMFLTYSGSGLLVLAVGLLFPLRLQTFLRLGLIALVGTLAALALWDVLNLGFTLRRLEEFTIPSASAYHRYVAPVRLIGDFIAGEPWSFWIGYGPGSITRIGTNPFYDFHHPTWAKALFEYGVLGLAAVIGLGWACLRQAPVPMQVRAAAFFCWIGAGGFLLTPEFTYLLLVFGRLFWVAPPEPEPIVIDGPVGQPAEPLASAGLLSSPRPPSTPGPAM
jgi:hypothetical protein